MGQVKYLAFHPDGGLLAIADIGEQKSVHLWDVAAGTLITLPGQRAVSCVAFTPDGRRLASLGYDGSVHLADARTGEQVIVLRSFGPPAGSERLDATAGLQRRRLAHRRPSRPFSQPLGSRAPLRYPQAEPKPDDVSGLVPPEPILRHRR